MKIKKNTVKLFYYIGRVLGIICVNLLILELLSLLMVLVVFKQGYKSIAESKDQYILGLTSRYDNQAMSRPSEGRFWGPRQLHPYFGYTFMPGWRDMNNHGFQTNFTYPYVAHKDEFVVGIFGGSVAGQIHGKAIPQFAKALLPELAKKGYSRVTTLNFTCGGYRQPMDLFVFLYFINTIDMAIFVEGFNEIIVNFHQKNFPIDFPPTSTWNVLASNNFSHSMLGAVGRLQYNVDRQAFWTGIFQKPLLRHSMACHILWKLIISAYTSKSQSLQKTIEKETEKTSSFTDVHPLGYGTEQIVDLYFQKYKQHLKNTHIAGRAAGIPCLFVLQPNQYLKNSKPYSEEEIKSYLTDTMLLAQVNLYYPRLKNIYASLAKEGVFTFDATLLFKNTVSTVYRDSCCHFNSLGLDIICKAIMTVLLNKEEFFTIIPNASERQGRLLELKVQK